MSKKHATFVLVVFWVLAGSLYISATVRQKSHLNLSATAGGQYPYLTYARGIAETGLLNHVGDRNRMPLYPALLSIVYDSDWDRFAQKATWMGITLSVAVLVGIGVLAHVVLPRLPATALTLAVAFGVFLDKASFVQAEHLFYGLFFLSWWLAVGLLKKPGFVRGAATGVTLALSYLTKASALPLLVSLIVFLVIKIAVPLSRKSVAPEGEPISEHIRPRTKPLLSAIAVLVCFVIVVFPYIRENKARFGRYFYNVNSEFFMWCDTWSQAKDFADTYHISSQYPNLPPERIPSPGNYLASHSTGECLVRLGTGLTAMGRMIVRSSYGYYLLGTLACCLVVAVPRAGRLRETQADTWFVVIFCAATLLAYLLAYAWYVQVAYGDRFVRSLIAPAMCAVLSGMVWFSRETEEKSQVVGMLALRSRLPAVLIVLILADGLRQALTSIHKLTPEFVSFYYNESLELQRAGDLGESGKGLAGVIRLDPNFAPAYLSLGMNHLVTGQAEKAVELLTEAVRLAPENADAHNSLGSAFAQAGRFQQAIRSFKRAVDLDPDFATAWFNLGGSYCQTGDIEDAVRVLEPLKSVSPMLHDRLASLIAEHQRPGRDP